MQINMTTFKVVEKRRAKHKTILSRPLAVVVVVAGTLALRYLVQCGLR